MRIRYLKNTPQILAASRYYLEDAEAKANRGQWRRRLPGGQRLELEIGSGRGQFLLQLARTYPDTLFIGDEKSLTVLARSIKKLEGGIPTGSPEAEPANSPVDAPVNNAPLNNLFLIGLDALGLTDAFAEGEVDRIYLNFSDPWPKEKHAKRRLSSLPYLKVYQQILHPAGDLCLKTDNQDFFLFSRTQLLEAGWRILEETRDLHGQRGEGASDNNNPARFILTEYETAFLKNGKKIAYLRAEKPGVTDP